MVDVVKYAFIAGELSPTLFSRGDLEKYDLAVARATNWFVDYRGGLSTRPGSQFSDFVEDDHLDTKFVPFKFSPDASETYCLVFSDQKLRFLQEGAYVTETPTNMTAATRSGSCSITAAAHGIVTGEWFKIFDVVGMTELNGRTFQAGTVTANTIDLLDPLTGVAINSAAYGAYVSGGTVARIYTVTTPYAAADLELLRAHQSRSVLYLTHRNYKTRTLTRVAHTNWTLALAAFGNGITRPSGVTINAGAGAAGVGFQVTAVDADGVESLPSDFGFDTTAVDYASTTGQAKVTWTGVTGAIYYKVYRTQIIPTGADVSRAMSVGFVGIAYGPEFVDRNIVPDFTQTPPVNYNPFADGAIEYIGVTAGGAGYTSASVLTITTATGSGFVGYPVVNASGAIIAVAIVNGGEGYLGTDTVNVTVGAGATFTLTLSSASGNDPGVSSVFQQRKIYAGSTNKPLTVWGSRPGDYENMDVSTIVQEDDSYEFELDSEEVAPITHLLATRSGLVIITQAGVWQLTGGQGVAVTPTNALADPQSYTGCSTLPPLPIDTDIVYQENKGSTVRLMAYNDYTKVFAGQDLSILSSHLVPADLPIKAWSYASDPFKLIHGVREDGIMLLLTLVKEQNIYGWSTQETQGLYTDVLALQEGTTDTVYFMTKRLINGRYTKMIETQVRRNFKDVEEAWCVDAGLSLPHTYPVAELQAEATTGTGIEFVASAAVFSAGDVGKVIRGGGGKAIITAYNSTTSVDCIIMRDITDVIPQTETPLPFASGEWSMDATVTTVTGLWHLEGATVKVLADGNVLNDKVVTNGSITLGVAASQVIVGLGYDCIIQLLPMVMPNEAVEGRRKIVKAVKARQYNSRGLKFGSSLTDLIPLKERTDEAYGEPTRLQAGITRALIPGSFNYEAQPYIVQEDPLPATVLGLILEAQLGDSSRVAGAAR